LAIFRVPQRVAAGVAYLDANMPGWYFDIDTKKLDIGDAWTCAIAQVFGPFTKTRVRFLGGSHKAAQMGFYAYFPVSYIGDLEYSLLTREWKRVIAEKMAHMPKHPPALPLAA